MLPYTAELQIFTQEVVIERDTSTPDTFGSPEKAVWEEVGTVPGRLWWWKGSKSTAKSGSNQYGRPEATFDETGGDMALPLGSNVRVTDRIGKIVDPGTEDTIEEGPFRIVALNQYETHIELSLERP